MAREVTRCIPDHYVVADKAPSSLPIEAGRLAFPFMRLPVELRLKVYREYLLDRYSISPEEIHEMVLDRSHWTKSQPEILLVSKTITAEVQDLLRHEDTITLRICWQDATFDGLAISCLQAKCKRLDYSHIAHLKVEIYPPHRDRPIDMACIWRHVQKLCSDLQRVSCVQHLSLHFMENEYASWGINTDWEIPVPVPEYKSDSSSSEIVQILDLFRIVTNVIKAQIHLPDSLREDEILQGSRRYTEEVMMRIKSLDEWFQKVVIEWYESSIARNKESSKAITGAISQCKLDSLCDWSRYWISTTDYIMLEKVWPHRDCTLNSNFHKPSFYTGDERLDYPYLAFYPYDDYHNKIRYCSMFTCI